MSIPMMPLSFPKKIEGIIFTEVIPQLLTEVNKRKLVELGAIVRKKSRTQMYEPLTDSLRKIQWVKLVGLKAIAIEKEINAVMESNVLVMDPLGQTAHTLCVTDCLVHTKSALDSMAVFLTDLLDLDVKGGDRDFKKHQFRQLVAQKDQFLKHKIKKLQKWFLQLQEIRDECIHRSALRSNLVHGPSKVGILPIPRKVMLDVVQQRKIELTENNFWSTKDFVMYHYSNLVTLFNAIIDASIQIERKDLKEQIEIPSVEAELCMFPIVVTQEMTAKKIKVKFSKSMTSW